MKREIGIKEGIIQLCTCVTCIALVWAIMFPFYEDKGYIADFFFSILFGIGGIGFYVPIGLQIKKTFDWLHSSKNKKARADK